MLDIFCWGQVFSIVLKAMLRHDPQGFSQGINEFAPLLFLVVLHPIFPLQICREPKRDEIPNERPDTERPSDGCPQRDLSGWHTARDFTTKIGLRHRLGGGAGCTALDGTSKKGSFLG